VACASISGHAHLDGDLVEAIETASSPFARRGARHRGRTDEHLVPLEARSTVRPALTAWQKIGGGGRLRMAADVSRSPGPSRRRTCLRAPEGREPNGTDSPRPYPSLDRPKPMHV